MKGGDGDDYLDGGEGYDRAGFFGAATGVHVDLRLQGEAQDTGQGMDTLVNIENLSGTSFADTLIGDDADNLILPSGGDGDRLFGMGGDDTFALVFGGSGIFNGGDGSDSVQFSSNGAGGLSALTVDLSDSGEQDTGAGLFTFKDIENVSGSDFDESNDLLTGSSAANILAGALADDVLTGARGDDLLLGDGSIGTDWPIGLSGPAAVLYEGAGEGADTLDGGAGADTLVGGGGGDDLSGGAGKDVLLYLSLSDSGDATGTDLIVDLNRKDTIDLSAIDADSTADGDQAFHLVKAFHGKAGELVRAYDAENEVTHFLMDVDGDREADMQIDATGDQHAFAGFVL
jgi:Ca2+-binding RTX toxin-like protein